MEDQAKYDAQSCTLEVSIVQNWQGKQTTLPGSTKKYYNVVRRHSFREHIREEYLVLQTLSRLFYGSSSRKFFSFCEIYQIGDERYLLVVGENLRGVETSWVCRVYNTPEQVAAYLRSL